MITLLIIIIIALILYILISKEVFKITKEELQKYRYGWLKLKARLKEKKKQEDNVPNRDIQR